MTAVEDDGQGPRWQALGLRDELVIEQETVLKAQAFSQHTIFFSSKSVSAVIEHEAVGRCLPRGCALRALPAQPREAVRDRLDRRLLVEQRANVLESVGLGAQ